MTLVPCAPAPRTTLRDAYQRVRSTTLALVEPLEPEDMVVQAIPETSPTKWHLAHVTWFFETLVLAESGLPYRRFDERFHRLFNSYYNSLGRPEPRDRRGTLSRPTVEQVLAYRRHVDAALEELLATAPAETIERLAPRIEIGLQHEQQHQELLLMDIKYALCSNPLRPAYREPRVERAPASSEPLAWHAFPEGTVSVGADGRTFAYDNEQPRHRVHLAAFELASRPVSVGEYLEFMADDGYARAELWLSDGWDAVQREGWRAPLHWFDEGEGWRIATLRGPRELDRAEPVCHVSYYEAEAYARWAGARLPTELEWEHAARDAPVEGNLLESDELHPRAPAEPRSGDRPAQLFGDVWEWTASAYAPYPGYRPFDGALSEYNGKFMSNQMVLRGGCCATPASHVRATYRNFYYPHQRWMFAGLRLAR